MPSTRRAFLGGLAAAGVLAPRLFVPAAKAAEARGGLGEAIAATARARWRFAAATADPAAAAADPALWTDVQQSWVVDRTLLNLENGGLQPSPALVTQAFIDAWMKANEAPSHTNSRILWPQVEQVRARLAAAFGCATEEMAITRNTTEGFLAVALGTRLEAGDEVLTTTHDYHRFRNAFHQREQREGIVLRAIPLPVPVEDPALVVERLAAAITPRTRVILLSHVFQLTGQVMPVREVVRLARTRDILVIVDGAHGFSHIPATRDELECDVYATSLHKWLSAPHGTGFLYVRKALIPSIWPLMPPTAKAPDDIRKFEAIGTASAAPFLAIAEALDFWAMIGTARKAARLVWLRERWLDRVASLPGVRLNTSRRPGRAGAIVNLDLEGLPPTKLAAWLWDRHRVLVAGVEHPEFQGIRVVPALYNTEAELDRFAELLTEARRRGLD
ncbi:MAG: aminotransferase class V-fold PLP-dependent enzyme [Opitutaceae bacterium]|nr:aminotransferase class V-fold PLP-dependent enzyme [Opitutaceae bacterium]